MIVWSEVFQHSHGRYPYLQSRFRKKTKKQLKTDSVEDIIDLAGLVRLKPGCTLACYKFQVKFGPALDLQKHKFE